MGIHYQVWFGLSSLGLSFAVGGKDSGGERHLVTAQMQRGEDEKEAFFVSWFKKHFKDPISYSVSKLFISHCLFLSLTLILEASEDISTCCLVTLMSATHRLCDLETPVADSKTMVT